MKTPSALLLTALAVLCPAAADAQGADEATTSRLTSCTMTFELQSWSAFYKSSKGEGTITCDNGQSAEVVLRLRGGGLTVGKGQIRDGRGKFSEVSDISEVLGSYVSAGAHAGAVKSADATVMTKGEVSLSLTGTGSGMELGIAAGKFTIKLAR